MAAIITRRPIAPFPQRVSGASDPRLAFAWSASDWDVEQARGGVATSFTGCKRADDKRGLNASASGSGVLQFGGSKYASSGDLTIMFAGVCPGGSATVAAMELQGGGDQLWWGLYDSGLQFSLRNVVNVQKGLPRASPVAGELLYALMIYARTAQTVDFWVNRPESSGVEHVGSVSAAAAPVTSAGNTLLLNRDDGTLPWSSSFYMHAVWPMQLDGGEAYSLLENPWQLFRPRTRRLYFAAASASGNVTVALTGQSAALAEGSFGPSTAVAASGQSATLTEGTLAPATSAALAGQSASLAEGAFGPQSAIAALGLAATSAEGALAPSNAVAVAGQAAAFANGQLLPDLRATLTGASLAATGGAFGVSLAPSLAGLTSTAASGTLANALAVALTGKAATLAQGTLTASTGSNVTVALTGLAATLAIGAFGPVASIALTGDAATASGGVVAPGSAASVAGQAAGATQGALAPQLGVTVAGDAASVAAGAPGASLAAYLSGETINSYYGLLTVGGQVLMPDPFFVVPSLSRSFRVPTLTRQFRVS